MSDNADVRPHAIILAIATPALRWTHHIGYWMLSATAVTLACLSNSGLFVIFALLFALGMLMGSGFDALRGSYTVTIDCTKDLVSVVASAPWRKMTERRFALSSFGEVATRWEANYESYSLELIENGGRSALLVKRFPAKRPALAHEDTSAACRSHIAAMTGLADAGILHHRLQSVRRIESRAGRVLEGAAWLLDAAVGFGLISGAAVAVAFGKFLLGGMLAAFAVGVFLRFKRNRVARPRQET